ncbi:uncharacterized protein LOC107267356 [Cephus cinctus]|uniref:Uncharacterized protein LOC107267356 n=1 Tax=Cephus cinctus TaxID=211228 RepID=A0AAJ7BVB6_CEPCN|nr:uncharacterized protein LOC107267356 [Cephus cinctus]XP_015594438.1 uncharacterized protein LOC107267356 [Cephus cinctus]XP_015594439.1 uncharacterized protein LOC107267356 [Cephus cinctus]XP_015594440.1 uncharacterized protein LOC107267356 [Cephus cinctus]XP_015594441.1 uncharacterized protein LOC107267356 [Cephus cinctus]XP_015594442.1 uncharacterized protein LOC107267356 [Cephus cinctus]XP_024940435.1 uncharacterized protein LOC107267356 [Cephus cinctus]
MEGESIDEDDDVVIEGSDLHDALINMGYTDFESAIVARSELPDSLNDFKIKIPSTANPNIYSWLINIYRYVMQDEHSSRKQLQTILQTKPLLDDHRSVIQSLISEHNNTIWSKIFSTLPVVSSTIIIATGILIAKQKSKLALIVGLPALIIAAYTKYIRWSAEKDLKHLVSLENDLYYLSKRLLKIVRHGYRMKVHLKDRESKFTDFGAERLKYVQSLTEIFISTLEHQSIDNYRVSLIVAKCLPSSINSNELVTNFERSTLVTTGEITYSVLKRLYYTYILIQSEMLQLLAIAYNSNTWSGHGKIQEIKLSLIIKSLVDSLTKYSGKLRKVVDEYSNCQLKIIRHEYKGLTGSRWQDLYMHLDLTSHKIQIVYNHIMSILQDIDVYEEIQGLESSFLESLKEKINEVHKKIDTAKSFAETSSLLIARMQNVNQEKLSCDEKSLLIPIMTPDVPVIKDSAPQIMDEVFEEYIKEEYLKSLYEDGDDVLQEKYKLDKSLAKNFMGELKEVLIEKQKSMTERELKALQRMYKNVEVRSAADDVENVDSTDSEIHKNSQLVPKQSQLPVTVKNDILNPGEGEGEGRKYHKPVSLPRKRQEVPPSELRNWADNPQISETHAKLPENLNSSRDIAVPPIPPPLPPAANNEDVEKCPLAILALNTRVHAFFNLSEETFVGSGENSEEELVDIELDNISVL